MRTHGRHGVRWRALAGEAEHLVRRSPSPVLLVQAPAGAG